MKVKNINLSYFTHILFKCNIQTILFTERWTIPKVHLSLCLTFDSFFRDVRLVFSVCKWRIVESGKRFRYAREGRSGELQPRKPTSGRRLLFKSSWKVARLARSTVERKYFRSLPCLCAKWEKFQRSPSIYTKWTPSHVMRYCGVTVDYRDFHYAWNRFTIIRGN